MKITNKDFYVLALVFSYVFIYHKFGFIAFVSYVILLAFAEYLFSKVGIDKEVKE